MRGLFVTGTDTGAGKTVLAAAIVASLRSRGQPVRPLKPVVTGLDEPVDPDWPPDHQLLARAAAHPPEQVNLFGYGPAVSPHLATEMEGRPLSLDALLAWVRAATRDEEPVVVEGVGGLLVPLSESYDVRDLARELALPVVIAARPGLGTINHTLLTLEAARTGGLDVVAVVLTPWPRAPGDIERSNLATIERLGKVPVSTLKRIPRADFDVLAAAGRELPLDRWLARRPSVPSRECDLLVS